MESHSMVKLLIDFFGFERKKKPLCNICKQTAEACGLMTY